MMKAKDLKDWLDTVHPDAIVQIKNYGWEDLEPENIHATYLSTPPRPGITMNDVCNVEDAT